jgi:hypothetical protein
LNKVTDEIIMLASVQIRFLLVKCKNCEVAWGA